MRKAAELWTVWRSTVRRAPAKIVVIEAAAGREWTAEELTALALSLSAPLARFQPGQRVAFRVGNGAEWLALFLALQARGLAAMPLDGGLPIGGALDLARRLKAVAIFAGERWHEIDRAAPRSRAACFKVTSGTSAEPKAVACRAAHLLADGRHVIATMGLRPGDRNLAAIPLGHSYGLGNLVLPLLLQGTAVVTAGEFLPRQLIAWMTQHRVTVFPGVPALFRVLAGLPAGPSPERLRLAISAGAMLPAETARAFQARFGVKLHNFYGSSETGGIAYDRSGAASLAGRSVGKLLRGVKVTVRAGCITVAGAAVVGRRRRLPDRGAWSAQGELVLLGRGGSGANIGGRKVHPLEIECALRSVPGVSDAHVWLGQAEGRDFIAAAVETRLSRAKLEHALAARLSAWKMPRHLRLAPELPRTARGKLDVAALKA